MLKPFRLWLAPVLAGILLSGCWAEIRSSGDALASRPTPPSRLMTLPFPAWVSDVVDSDPERIPALESSLVGQLRSTGLFSRVSTTPFREPAARLELRLSRNDRSSEESLNTFKTVLNALSFFLLNPLFSIEHRLTGHASLKVTWPDGGTSSLEGSCSAETRATIDKENGMLDQARHRIEKDCIATLTEPLIRDGVRHASPSTPAPEHSSMEQPQIQRRFNEGLSEAQRMKAVQDICNVLGFRKDAPDYRSCLLQMQDVELTPE